MKITREKDYLGFYELKMIKGPITLTISFGGNGDLYWNLINTENFDSQDECFIIDKEDGTIYDLFQKLYFRLSNHQIFQVNEREETFESLKTLHERNQEYNEELVEHPYFQDLCNGKYVEWHSDNEPFETGNRLIMSLDPIVGKLIINIKRTSRKYDFLNVCFTHSGSRYSPFDLAFYENYRKLCEMDLETTLPSESIGNFDEKTGIAVKELKRNNKSK